MTVLCGLVTSKDFFFVKNAYYVELPVVEKAVAGESSSKDFRTPLWKKMWQLKFPPKVRIFAWRACMNGLPTMLNLGKRGVNTDALCPLYGKELESTIHALLLCGKVREVWWNWQTCPVNIMAENHGWWRWLCTFSKLARLMTWRCSSSRLGQ